MKTKRGVTAASVQGLLSDPRILRAVREEDGPQTWYNAVGVVQVLTESEHANELWIDLKEREPALAAMSESVDFSLDAEGHVVTEDALNLEGVLRLVQATTSPRAERIKRWMIESARQRLEEAENPELALLRARRLYEQRGYSRRWIDKRLRGVSARHELTSEWYRRGARESDEYRALTNELVRGTFGMDVESYRRYKGLSGVNQNLRDHMTDLELALTTLAETTAAVLHRERASEGFEKLVADVRNAGEIVAGTVREIQKHGGKSIQAPPQQQQKQPAAA